MTALGDGITYADADESVESEPYIVGSGSAPPAVEDVVIYNFVSGDDEITVSGVLPNERIRIYDAPSGGCLLGEECGYSEDDIVSFSIDSGFDPEMTAIYVTSTCLEPESPESERIEVQIPAPSILQEGSYHDFEVDSVAYGYGRISFMVTTSQVNAIKEALGLTEDDSVTLRGFVGKEEFSDINELPTINDPNFDVVEIEPNTPTAISKLATNNSCFPYAFAVYDEEDNVLLSYVSESDTMIVYSPFDSISPSSVAGNVEFSQEITLTLESTMATRFAAGDLSSKISLDGVFEYLTVESVTRNSDTQIVIGISGNLSSAGRGIINIAASAFTEEPNPDPVSGPIPLSACINVNLP